MTRYVIEPDRSVVFIEARSSVHPINTRTDGLEGLIDCRLDGGGALDLATPPAAQLSLRVDRLRSGNPLEDRELRRRIDAKHFPTIDGVLREIKPTADADGYLVAGDITFRGVTLGYEHPMTFTPVDEHTLLIAGDASFDVRDFGMDPPRILMLRVEPVVHVRVEIIAATSATS